ncbi:MAG: helix-turn-helix domain-containing protein [Caulobacteraceae bacterium]|nr:helix-turn-helix domain-containing protein [Caulobacteraceae bacterium]
MVGRRARLRASGLSFRAVAARIGVPKSTVFRWLSSE